MDKIRRGICVKCRKSAVQGSQFCEGHRRAKNDNIYAYRKRNHDKVLEWGKGLRTRIKQAVFEAYGGARCSCCSETALEFLTIDHIEGGGRAHRAQLEAEGIGWGNAMYRWLRDQGYPPGYRVLCMNCNFAYGQFGYCPHQRRLKAVGS